MLSSQTEIASKKIKVPASYICSITGQIMVDPVFTADGHTYEREAIEAWLKTNNTSPKTMKPLANKDLTPNWDKRSDISEFLDEHPELYEGEEVYLSKAWREQLAVAIKNNQAKAVQEWLNKDRRLLTVKLEADHTAFHLACQFGSAELTELLLETLIAKNKLDKALAKPTGFKPIHLNALLKTTLEKGNTTKCALLLKLGAELAQLVSPSNITLLHYFAIKGKLEAVRWLLEQRVALDVCNAEGNTPLLLALLNNHTELARFLLENKANPEIRNKAQQNAITIAVLKQNTTILPLLVGAENAPLPPLHLALELNDKVLLKALLNQGTISIEAVNAQQRTAFFVAVEKGDIEAASLLLEKGANPHIACGVERYTSLHIVAWRGDLAMLKLLLQTKAATAIDYPTASGYTPLHFAVQSGQAEIIPLLLGAGAGHKTKSAQGLTPIELAKQQNKLEIAVLIENKARALKQARWEEIATLRQVVREQSTRIEQLEKLLEEKVKSEIMPLKKESSLQSEQLKALQDQQRRFLPSLERLARKESPTLPPNKAKELSTFLRLVAESEQNQAEAMLKSSPDLALLAGDVTDLSKRTFRNITGFQYAVWALDNQMWEMIRKYLTPEEASKQAQALEMGSWVKKYGVQVNWMNLVTALKEYCDNYSKWSSDGYQRNQHWMLEVGTAQLLLPAHVVKKFYPTSYRRTSDWYAPAYAYSTSHNFYPGMVAHVPSSDTSKAKSWHQVYWHPIQYSSLPTCGGFGYDRDQAPVIHMLSSGFSAFYTTQVQQREKLLIELAKSNRQAKNEW